MDLEVIATSGLERYFARNIHEPCVLGVDPLALPAFRGNLWKRLLRAGTIRTIFELNEASLDSENNHDTLCADIGPARLIVLLVTSAKGETLLERFCRTIPQDFTVFVLSTSPISGPVLALSRVRVEQFPFCIVPLSPSSFTLTSETCSTPTAFMLNEKKRDAYALDTEVDLDASYRSKMKRIAMNLNSAISSQVGWDISDGIYSMGFGAGLVANTICAKLSETAESGNFIPLDSLREKACLLIVDRTLDWVSPLDDPTLKPIQRLHEQLILADQSQELWPNLAHTLEKGTISRSQALALAVRACSLAGKFDSKSSDVIEFAKLFGGKGDRILQILQEIATARARCWMNTASDSEEAEDASNDKFLGTIDSSDPLVWKVLREVWSSTGPLPHYLVHAKKLDVTKVALNIFGSVFGGDSMKTAIAQTMRLRKNLVVFFLGGFTMSEADRIHANATSECPDRKILVCGTEAFKNQNVLQESMISWVSLNSGTTASATSQNQISARNPRNFAALFT